MKSCIKKLWNEKLHFCISIINHQIINTMKLKLILLLALVPIFIFSQEQKNTEKHIPIDQKLAYFLMVVDTLQHKAKTPGLAIAIVYDHKLVYKGNFGYRDLKNKLPVTNSTLFEIGSLTKAFTGVIASQLVQEEKIQWDDKVLKHIPEFKLEDDYASKNATIKDLFTHRVGLDKHYYLIYGNKFSRNELLNKIPYMSFNGSFREKYLYNNFMYTVAGILEERVTKKTWEELIKENILETTKHGSFIYHFCRIFQL